MKSHKDYKRQKTYFTLDPETGKQLLTIPPLQLSSGYMVDEYVFNGRSLTKLELFAYFAPSLLPIIEAEVKKMPRAGKVNPSWHHPENPGTEILFRESVMWNKSQVNVKAYTYIKNKNKFVKVELTRQKTKGIGSRKPLEPVGGLNTLGALMKRITRDAIPLEGLPHDFFDFPEQFIEKAEKHYINYDAKGQLKKIAQHKLHKNIRFGSSDSQEQLFSRYIDII